MIVLTEQVMAALSCACVQAVKLKQLETHLTPTLKAFQTWVLESFAYVEEDRPLQAELQHLVDRFENLALLSSPVCH